jgi:hypothetical protein
VEALARADFDVDARMRQDFRQIGKQAGHGKEAGLEGTHDHF